MTIPRSVFHQIEDLVNRGAYQAAWDLLSPYIEQYPNDFDVLHNKAVLLMNLGNLAASLEAFQRAWEIDQFNENHLYNFAGALHAAGKNEESLILLRKLIALNPNKSKALLSAGEVCYSLRRYRDAAEYYERYIEIFPHKRHEMLPKLIYCLQWAEAELPDNAAVKLRLYERMRELDI